MKRLTVRNVLSSLSAGAVLLALTITSTAPAQTPAQVGEWSNVQTWPVHTIHATLTHQGTVLVWGEAACPDIEDEDTRLWDPTAGSFTQLLSGLDFFCAGHSILADGKILVAGGGCHYSYNGEAMTFTPGGGPNGPWESIDTMNYVRWYPTLTTLPDGRVLATSGDDSHFNIVTIPEIYDPAVDSWQTLPLADTDLVAGLDLDLYPFLFVAPDGRVFATGPKESGNSDAFLNLNTGMWEDLITGTGFGEHSSAVMYAPGKILSAGGEVGGDDTKNINLNDSSPAWVDYPGMNVSRHDHDLVVLPNGRVLAVGGHPTDLRAEWIDPDAPFPLWIELAASNESRLYHSATLLLPDGRVLAAGGELDVSGIDQFNAEFYSPPYLYTGTERPIIGFAPSTVGYDTLFRVRLGDGIGTTPPMAADIAEVNLIRLGSITHGFDQNQRFVPLTCIVYDSQTLGITSPLNSNIAPPGDYMMFLISDDGAVSKASFLRLTLP